jgi:hypothetical protein
VRWWHDDLAGDRRCCGAAEAGDWRGYGAAGNIAAQLSGWRPVILWRSCCVYEVADDL